MRFAPLVLTVSIGLGVFALGACASPAPAPQVAAAPTAVVPIPKWQSSVLERPADWYAGAEALALADRVIAWQSAEGGWPKNTDLSQPLPEGYPSKEDALKANTFDNNATTDQLVFLAKLISAGKASPAHRAAFDRGFDYMLAAQYPAGGWPQFFPLREGYYSHITFNDDVMERIMTILRAASEGEAPYGFLDAPRRTRAADALRRGIDIILHTQVKQDGKLTGWCAQHDVNTLAPAWARAYEPPSLSGQESVGLVRVLMAERFPTPEVIAAVEGAVDWLRASPIRGKRIEDFTGADGKRDRRLVDDPAAPDLWARFYELGTNRPLYLDRRSVFFYSFDAIEQERRTGYHYQGKWPQRLLEKDYPRWKASLVTVRGN